MKEVIQILALMECLIFITQVIVLFVQHKMDKTNNTIAWWVRGSTLIAVGALLMPLVTVKNLAYFAILSNPLVVLGQIFLYVGIVRFFGNKENRILLSLIFIVFLISYGAYIDFHNSISERTIIVCIALAIISLMTAYEFYSDHKRLNSLTTHLTAAVFLSYGAFLILRALITILQPPVENYTNLGIFLLAGFIVPIIASTLWTYGFILMLNQLLNMENKLEKEKMHLIFNTTPDATIITRLEDGVFIDVNEGFSAMTGYTREEVIGSVAGKKIWQNKEDRKEFLKILKRDGVCAGKEFNFKRKDGSPFVGLLSANSILIHGVENLISSIHDITIRKREEEALLESEEKYKSILNASPDDITITDMEGKILMISPAAKKMYGFEPDFDDFVGVNFLDYLVPEEAELAKENIGAMFKNGYRKATEYHALRKDGSIFNIEVNSEFIRNSKGEPFRMVFIIRDITERKLAEKKIQELIKELEIERNIALHNSITDSLTGLSNRRYLDDVLEKEFHRSKRFGLSFSLIMLDVDYFKKYNDTYGHLAGDDCLRQIGMVLKTVFRRATDIVGRYGGEEFIILLPETNVDEAFDLAERINAAIKDLAIPHVTSDVSEYVTISIGIAVISSSGIETAEEAVSLVDDAMYRAKQNGRNRIEIFLG